MPLKLNGLDVLADASVPIVVADTAFLFDFIDGSIRIHLAVVARTDADVSEPPVFKSVAQLAMGPVAAQSLAVGLFDYLKKIGHGGEPPETAN